MCDPTVIPASDSPPSPSSTRRGLWARLTGISWTVWLLMVVIGVYGAIIAVRLSAGREWFDATWAWLPVGSVSFWYQHYRGHPFYRRPWLQPSLRVFRATFKLLLVAWIIIALVSGILMEGRTGELHWMLQVETAFFAAVLLASTRPGLARPWPVFDCPACRAQLPVPDDLIIGRLHCQVCSHRWRPPARGIMDADCADLLRRAARRLKQLVRR